MMPREGCSSVTVTMRSSLSSSRTERKPRTVSYHVRLRSISVTGRPAGGGPAAAARVRPCGSRVCGVAGRLASDLMQPARLLCVEVVRVAEQIHVLQREASDWSEISCGVLVRHRDLRGYVALQHSGTTFP